MKDDGYDRSEEDDREYLKATETGDLREAVRRLVAVRDAAIVEWHRIRDLHAAAITDLRVVVAERDAALADLADERNDSVQDQAFIAQLKAENKRLRDALEQIGSKDFDMTELGRIARAALAAPDTEETR